MEIWAVPELVCLGLWLAFAITSAFCVAITTYRVANLESALDWEFTIVLKVTDVNSCMSTVTALSAVK